MNTIINGVREYLLTTCEQYADMYNNHARHITVVGRFTAHDGNAVWVKLGGCGQSDNHLFEHRHMDPAYINRMFDGKLIRVNGTRYYNWNANAWQYQWTIGSVNLWEQGMDMAPSDIKNMCGTNC